MKEKPSIAGVPLYTPNLEKAEFILDLPFFDPKNRHYELLEDEVVLYQHIAVGYRGQAWRLRAHNLQKPNDEPVDLFIKHTNIGDDGEIKPLPGVNIIDDSICSASQRDLVIELGRMEVDIMNRMPADLKLAEWRARDASGRAAPPVRMFIDSTSLVLWKQRYFQDFNLGSLTARKGKTVWNPNFLGNPFTLNATVSGKKSKQPELMSDRKKCQTLWETDSSNTVRDVTYGIRIKTDHIDHNRLDSASHLDGYHIYGTPMAKDANDENMIAGCKLTNIVLSNMCGMVGKTNQIQQLIEDERQAFISPDKVNLVLQNRKSP